MASRNVLLLSVMIVGSMTVVAAQKTHKLSWIIPGNNNTLTTELKQGSPIQAGDTLEFDYVTGTHNVLQVSKLDYDTCNISSPKQIWVDGPTSVPLMEAGTFWFICGYPGHCEAGQVVIVDVIGGSSPSTLAPAPTVTPGGGTAASPAPASQPGAANGLKPSAATMVAVMFAVILALSSLL